MEFGMQLLGLSSVICTSARLRFFSEFVVERFHLKPTYLKNKARMLMNV